MLLAVDHRAVAVRDELAVAGGHLGRRDPLDQLLGAASVGDEVGHGDHREAVAGAVGDQVGHPRHRAVLVHDLADHPGRLEPRHAGQVDRRLGLARALEHAERARAEGEDVARPDEVGRLRGRVDRHPVSYTHLTLPTNSRV